MQDEPQVAAGGGVRPEAVPTSPRLGGARDARRADGRGTARKLVAALRHSDPGLAALLGGLLLVAAVCLIFRGQASPLPPGKSVVSICRSGFKRDREEMKELKAAFEQARPDTHIKVIQTLLERKPDTMIAAGVPSDLVLILCDRVDYYIDADALLDLAPYVAADPLLEARLFGGPDGTPPDFYEQTVAPFVREHNGRRAIYALPLNYTPFLIYYSKDLFDRYQVPYPDDQWDWAGLRARALALTRDEDGRRPDQPGFDRRRVVCYGFQFSSWQHPVETFIHQAGGRLIDETGTRVVADDPRTVAALQFLYDLKERDGVIPDFVPSGARAEQQFSFRKNRIAMHLGGVFEISSLRDQAPDLDWDIAPLPRGPQGRRASVVFAHGLGIPREAANPQGAFEFLRFLLSDAGLDIIGRHQVFLPCRRSVLNRLIASDTQRKPHSTWVLTHDMDHGYAQAPFATRQYYADVYDCINEHLEKLLQIPDPPFGPAEACARMTSQGNAILQRDRPVGRATPFGIIVLAVAVLPAGYLVYRLVRRPRLNLPAYLRREERWGYLLISPWLLGFLVFAAFPILVSIGLSFAQWQSLGQFTRSEFIGVENYRMALTGEDPKFWHALWITARYAFLAVPAGLVAGLALALLMNQAVRGITIFRTLYYLPAVLPSVAVAVLWWYLFDQHFGWVNRVLALLNVGDWIPQVLGALGWRYPVAWLNDGRVTPYVFIIMSLWTVGGGMIIYLAGLQSIPTELYEAAEIDGAGPLRRLRHVTLPLLTPVILFNLIMGIIGSFQVFNIAFVLFDGFAGPGDSALFYGLHLFREAFLKYRLGYASALAWILFTIVLLLTALVFKSSPLWVHYESRRRARA